MAEAAAKTGDGRWEVRRLATHGGRVHDVVGTTFLGSEPVAASAGDDGLVRLWDLGTGALRLTMEAWRPSSPDPSSPGQTSPVQSAAPDGPLPAALAEMPTAAALAVLDGWLYAGWSDGTVGTLDLAMGLEPATDPIVPARVGTTPLEDGGAIGVPISALLALLDADGRHRLVSATTDGAIRLSGGIDDPHHRPSSMRVIRNEGPAVGSLAVVEDGDRHILYAGMADGEVHQWEFTDDDTTTPEDLGPQPVPLPLPTSRLVRPVRWKRLRGPQLLAVASRPNRHLLLLTDDDDHVAAFEAPSGPLVGSTPAGIGEITALHALPPGGPHIAVIGGSTGNIAFVGYDGTPTVGPPVDIGEPVAALGDIDGHIVVGGATGGVYLVAPDDSPVVSDKVELQDDVPGQTPDDDRLRRHPLAEALAVRLERRHEEGREASFLVHLDGPWGSGKTTVLNFVADELGEGWTIVRYNAWRQTRVGPPWWTLLTALRDELWRRRSTVQRVRLWCREMFQQRIRRAAGLPATIVLLLAAAAVFALVRPAGADASETLTTVQGLAATLGALATLYAGAQFVAQFFGWNSPRGAKAFQDLDANPMDRVAEHFSWLVRQEERPIAYFVDDLDRCPADDVVELLESVQTLVRDAAETAPGGLSPCFVVAGDGAWIRNAFEQHYSDFATQIAEPGRPLGYLFLNKIFQLTLPVPRVGPTRQEAFFRELLGLEGDGTAATAAGTAEAAATDAAVVSAQADVQAAPDDEAQQQVLSRLPQAVREVVAPAAVRRQTEPAFAQATEHRLAGFAGLLPDNPRAVKRFLNAFAMTRTVRTLEGQAIPTPSLALWTILLTRWPQLADALAAHPNWLTPALPDPSGLPPQIPEPIRNLLDDPDVQAVLAFPDGGPLTPDLVRACRGG